MANLGFINSYHLRINILFVCNAIFIEIYLILITLILAKYNFNA